MFSVKNTHYSTLFISILFVILYGSGFVGAKLGLPFAKPLVFLTLRFLISAAILFVIAILIRVKWPSSWQSVFHTGISGFFLVGLFSIGTWVSIDMGLPPATSALIIALQPLSVAIGSRYFLKTKINISQWFGLLLGLFGVILVVGDKAHFSIHYLLAVLMSFLGLLGLTVGNLYQKRFCSEMNIVTGGIIQSGTSGIVCLIIAYFTEPFQIQWTGQFIIALTWMSLIVSLAAVSFLYVLLKRGESHTVASLFYLVPVATAVIAYLVFGSTLHDIEIAGMFITMTGVAIVNFKPKFRNAPIVIRG